MTTTPTTPIPMRLCCEDCGKLHIDEGEFATKPHHTHSCQYCGLTWRPAVVHTVGVQFLPGFKNDAPVTKIKCFTGYSGPIEPGSTWQHISVGTPLLRVKGLGSYVSGGSRIDFTDGHSLEEQSFRTYYRPYTTPINKTESPFKLDDYVRCKADGRIGRVYQVDGKGDLECPDSARLYVQAIDQRVIDWVSWIGKWFKPEELEAWAPRRDERVRLKKDGDVLTVSDIYSGSPQARYGLADGSTWVGSYQQRYLEPAPPPLSICCILGGEEVYVDADPNDSIERVRNHALLKRKTHHAVLRHDSCEIRDVKGVWIDPVLEVKDLESLQGTERPTIYINPPVGSGG
jgi:hypothetical protein